MSESRLRAFAERAEQLVDLPDVEALERRGHDVRARRRTTAVAAALLVAIGGTAVVQDRFQRADGPDEIDTPGRPVMAYPGAQMQDLGAGTYELFPSSIRGEPTALLTLPEGWNSWQGPNRFDGHRAGDPTKGHYNEVPLGRATWYVGVVVVKVLGVGADLCAGQGPHVMFVHTMEETVAALGRVPGYRVVGGPQQVTAFGYPATHLVMSPRPALATCGEDNEADLLITSANQTMGGAEHMECWVLEVDGVPLTVVASTSTVVPDEYLAELDDVVSSIEFVTHED